MGSKYIEMLTSDGFDLTVYWDAPYGSTTAYMWWEVHTNTYGRTFDLALGPGYSTRYNSGTTIPLGTYRLYVYRNGSYRTDSGDFTIAADPPPTRTVWYSANGRGTAPDSQTVQSGSSLTLRSKIANQSGTSYTVSYNANGGSTTPSSSTSTYTYQQTYWNTNSSGTGTNYTPGGSYTISSDLDLYAVWSGSRAPVTLASAISKADGTASRTVTFDANGGTCSTTSLASTATVTYAFNKWAAGSASGTQYSAGTSFTPSSNTTMYATWTPTTGSYSAITLPTATRTGYDFKGWSTDSSATSGTTGSYTPTGNVTLYATWTKKTYSVTYNANGYGTAPSSQTKTYGTALTLRSFISDQTTTGYTVSFNENSGSTTPSAITSELTKKQTYWNTNSSGTGTNYSSGGTYSDDKAATLYAIWGITVNGSITLPGAIARASDSVNYTISYNANGGTSTPSNQTITRITPYSFDKWAEGSVSGTKYEANATYTPTAAKTMYAIWTTGATTGTVTLQSGITKNDTTATGFKVTFNANGGSCSTTSLNATDTTEWTFSKWNTKSDGTGTDYSPNTTYSFDADISLYAKWTSSTTNGSVTLPTPTRNGYTFQGWSTNQNATSGTKGQYTPTDDVTLYAIWSMDNSIVHYNNNGVDVPCIVYYNNNGTAVLCNVYYNNNGTTIRI